MSPKFETIKRYYDDGIWGENTVRKAEEKGWITHEECNIILGIVEDEQTPDESTL